MYRPALKANEVESANCPMKSQKLTGRPSPKSGVLLIDDHSIVRQGLANIINQEADLFVCGEADDALKGLDAVENLKPSIVLLDISLPGMNGIEFIKNIKARYPGLPIVVLSMHDESLYAERALRAGALAYIMKKSGSAEVMDAIRKALRGEYYMNDSIGTVIMKKALGNLPQAAESPVAALTDRELEVFEMIGNGKTTREIAGALNLSIKTVDAHRTHIKAKLSLHNAAELIQHAVRYVEGQGAL